MDKSLDQVIKENPRKFNRNQRRNNGVGQNKKKNNSPLLTGVAKNNTGRVTKKQQSQGGKGRVTGKKPVRTGVKPTNSGKVVGDVRNKLLAKNRMKIVDARDKLAAITKKTTTDLRLKLSSKKPVVQGRGNKGQGGRARSGGVKPLMRELGNRPLTRTILGRTVENELARFSGMAPSPPIHYAPPLRYEPPPPPQYYPSYHQPHAGYDFNRSSAAMDCDPPPSASQRIRTTGFVGATSSNLKSPVRSEQGHRVYVSNLHPKVTEEDIGELFGDIGVLLRATLQRPGVAEIVYQRHEDAQGAVDIYNNRQLDGLPMHCSLGSPYMEMSSRRDLVPPPSSSSSKPSMTNRSRNSNKAAYVSPDLNTIHRALFTKNPDNGSQIFTVTMPGKDRPVL